MNQTHNSSLANWITMFEYFKHTKVKILSQSYPCLKAPYNALYSLSIEYVMYAYRLCLFFVTGD